MPISVYITSFNKGAFLTQAIDSVLDQTLPPSEIIIVDDCSSDNSKDIINGFKSRYPDIIKAIYNERNFGISRTRNIAISYCSGDIITFVDADDYFLPRKIELEHSILKNNDYSCVFSNYVFIDEVGKEIGFFSVNGDEPTKGNIFKENFIRNFQVSSGADFHNEMFYKSCAQDIGLYDEKIKIWEDWDFRIRMSKKFQYGYCPELNSAYRKLKNGLHNSESELHYREQIKIYKKNKHLMIDLKNDEKSIVNNKVYSRLKGLFLSISKKNLDRGKYLRFILDLVEFILTFKMKKALGYIFRKL